MTNTRIGFEVADENGNAIGQIFDTLVEAQAAAVEMSGGCSGLIVRPTYFDCCDPRSGPIEPQEWTLERILPESEM